MDDINSLSNMEHEAIRCTQEGLTNAEIGQRLGLATPTVYRYLTHAYRKLGLTGETGARTKAAIMVYCHDQGTHSARLLRQVIE